MHSSETRKQEGGNLHQGSKDSGRSRANKERLTGRRQTMKRKTKKVMPIGAHECYLYYLAIQEREEEQRDEENRLVLKAYAKNCREAGVDPWSKSGR